MPDDYRGLNANMHSVEAFLAVSDVPAWLYRGIPGLSDDPDNETAGDDTDNEAVRGDSVNSDRKASGISLRYRERAGRIIDHVIGWAAQNNYRIPEHFTKDWKPEYDMNKDKPDDPFKPYGATPGHALEWARLISQWASCSLSDPEKYIDVSCRLYERALADAWDSDGAPGIVYTTDWEGRPVVHDRMHWTLAEAINTSAVLYRMTGNKRYADDYAMFMEYLDTTVLDHSCGSWFHQLDDVNRLKETVWPGKPDLYHAFQAMLIPYSVLGVSVARAVYDRVSPG